MGGEDFHQPAVITDEIMAAIKKKHSSLHHFTTPQNIRWYSCGSGAFFPGVPQVAVFDTAFHQTIPPHAYHYALSIRTVHEKERIRRYGFHGTSHQFCS